MRVINKAYLETLVRSIKLNIAKKGFEDVQIKAFDVPSGQFRDVYISAQTTTMKEPLKYSIAKKASQLPYDLMEKARLEVLEDIVGNLDGAAAYKSLKRRGVTKIPPWMHISEARQIAYIDTTAAHGVQVLITYGELVHFAEISGFTLARNGDIYRFARIAPKQKGIV